MACSTYLAPLYILFNVVAALSIVFANKAVFAVYRFPYPVYLTVIHTAFTTVGTHLMATGGVFEPKSIEWREVVDLAAAYVAYIVLGNVSIKMNPVGFYQVTKALIAPTILAINSVKQGVWPKKEVLMSVALLTAGILAATVTDDQVMSNLPGIIVGVLYVASTAMYNIWAGAKQKSLGAGSNQLLHRFSPVATILLLVAAPATERIIGSSNVEAQFQLTGQAFVVITASACLGLLVSLSTFLVIGHTSALTYNVVGHIKTVGVIAGGVFFYGEIITFKKALGLSVAAAGIAWYSAIQMRPPPAPKSPVVSNASSQPNSAAFSNPDQPLLTTPPRKSVT